MMKKLITGLLVLFLLSASVACAKKTAPAPVPVSAPAPAPGSIRPSGTPPGPMTPVKAHYSAGVGVVPSKTVYMPGEEIELELVLNNESIEPVFVGSLPPSLIIHKTGEDPESIKAVHTFPTGTDEVKVGVNEKVSYGKLTWDQKDESGNQVPPGWYNCQIKYTVRKESPPPMDWGAGSGERLFLIQYPQGAMEKTIDLNRSQTANGLPLEVDNEIIPVDITLILKRVELTQEGVSFFVLLTSPDYPLPGDEDIWWRIALDEHAEYVFDGTVKDARGANTKYTEDGIELRWGREGSYRDPIPSDTKELSFIITRLGDDWEGSWDFKIPLE